MWSIQQIENDEIVKFLKRKVFFDTPFLLKDVTRFHIITDSETAIDYATNENSDDFSDWQTLWDNELEKAGVYENMTDHIEYKINEFLEKEFNYSKDFSNATNKVGYDEGAKISLLFNNMEGDMFRLLKCVATGKSSSFFDKVREAYLNNGFPCGWDGLYPNGKLVVYSNE